MSLRCPWTPVNVLARARRGVRVEKLLILQLEYRQINPRGNEFHRGKYFVLRLDSPQFAPGSAQQLTTWAFVWTRLPSITHAAAGHLLRRLSCSRPVRIRITHGGEKLTDPNSQ